MNAPNDVAVHSNGSIWFTDPGYGIMSNYEGHKAPFELPAKRLSLGPGNTPSGSCRQRYGQAQRHLFPSSALIGKIHLPETCANLCFGGAKKNRLLMAASQSLYALSVEAQGAQAP